LSSIEVTVRPYLKRAKEARKKSGGQEEKQSILEVKRMKELMKKRERGQ